MTKFFIISAVAFAIVMSMAIFTTAWASNNHPEEDKAFDCDLKTERPHSSTAWDQVSVKGFTRCETSKDILVVETTLYVKSGGSFISLGPPSSRTVHNSRYSGKVRDETGPCQDGTYMGLSKHIIIDGDATRVMFTQNIRYVTCS